MTSEREAESSFIAIHITTQLPPVAAVVVVTAAWLASICTTQLISWRGEISISLWSILWVRKLSLKGVREILAPFLHHEGEKCACRFYC
jgi:hypothetical protein